MEIGNPARARTGPQEPLREARLIWPLEALLRWSVTVLAAAIVLVGACFDASGKVYWGDQVLAADVAVIAVIISSAASIGLLVSGRRQIGLRREALLGDPGYESATSAQTVADALAGIPTQRSSALIGGPGMLHYHRADCAMTVGRDWPEGSAAEHSRAGRSRCGVCQP